MALRQMNKAGLASDKAVFEWLKVPKKSNQNYKLVKVPAKSNSKLFLCISILYKYIYIYYWGNATSEIVFYKLKTTKDPVVM